jgi:hypothetical protein
MASVSPHTRRTRGCHGASRRVPEGRDGTPWRCDLAGLTVTCGDAPFVTRNEGVRGSNPRVGFICRGFVRVKCSADHFMRSSSGADCPSAKSGAGLDLYPGIGLKTCSGLVVLRTTTRSGVTGCPPTPKENEVVQRKLAHRPRSAGPRGRSGLGREGREAGSDGALDAETRPHRIRGCPNVIES